MSQLIGRRLVVVIGCGLLLAAGANTVHGEDFFGYCEVVSGPKSAVDIDAPPAYVAPRPTAASPAPVTPAVRPAASPVVHAWSSADPQMTSQARRAIDYYGGAQAVATLGQIPRPPAIVSSATSSLQRGSKPFQTINQDPTVSPYLNLYRDEADPNALPNYFAFVRPQLEQIETNRQQMREMQQLRRQVQGGSPAAAGPPTIGRAARFMDTAQFYGQWQR